MTKPRGYAERHRFGWVERVPTPTPDGTGTLSVASVSTTTSASAVGWQDTLERGFERAKQTLRGITGIQAIEAKARVEDAEITEFPVAMQVIFVLEHGSQ
jgi:flavin-binding protein dodecin